MFFYCQVLTPENIKIQKYLVCEKLTKEEVQLLFTLRVRSFPVKSNMKNQFLNNMQCRACREPDSVEDEVHLCQYCDSSKYERNFTRLNIDDIYKSLTFQVEFIRVFKLIARKWKLLLELR